MRITASVIPSSRTAKTDARADANRPFVACECLTTHETRIFPSHFDDGGLGAVFAIVIPMVLRVNPQVKVAEKAAAAICSSNLGTWNDDGFWGEIARGATSNDVALIWKGHYVR